jgi:uncharacterized protein YabE (DUF348 family)
MKISLLRLYYLITILLIAGTLLLAFGMRKTIIISVDGKEMTTETRALTVGAALKSKGILLSPIDKLNPASGHLLKNGENIIVEHARRIYIHKDGKTSTLISAESKLSNILLQTNNPIKQEDQIQINGEIGHLTSTLNLGTNPVIIQIQSAEPIKVTNAEGEQIYYTSSPTLIDALWEIGIVVESADQLTLPPETLIEPNLAVGIKQGRPVKISTQSDSQTIYSAASTIGEVLTHAGLSPQGMDYSIPSPDKPVPEDGEIRLIRMREEVIIEHTPIPFETEYQPADDLELDTRSTIQPGEYGLVAKRIRVIYKDGVEVSKIPEDEWTAKEPQPQIVGYGTKIVKRVADTPDGPIEYWRALYMYAVSYRPDNNNYGTASGIPLKKGIVAIDRNYIPFYTRLYIPDT